MIYWYTPKDEPNTIYRLTPQTPIGSPFTAEKEDISRQIQGIEATKERERRNMELANSLFPPKKDKNW